MSIAQAGVVAIALVCVVTLVIGACGLRLSRTTSDFYVAGRSVSAGWNASAIGGEYLSAASFLGVAGLVYALGVDMLWFPVGYTVGYLVLLVLVAAPLRRSGAYTLPDFAEARLESRGVRAAGVAAGRRDRLALPAAAVPGRRTGPQHRHRRAARAGQPHRRRRRPGQRVAGGMRSITLVQAVQYWLKLTAISVPAFVLLALWLAERRAGPERHVVGRSRTGRRRSAGSAGATTRSTRRTRTILALCFGTMGLPHVLVRFYTNPDGRAARRTTLVVVALLGVFYLFTPVYGVLGRVYLPTLPDGARADSVTLLLPAVDRTGRARDGAVRRPRGRRVRRLPLHRLRPDHLGRRRHRPGLPGPHVGRRAGGDIPRIRTFRIAAVVAVVDPVCGELARGQHQPRRHGRASPSRWRRRRSARCWSSASGGDGSRWRAPPPAW